jgi:hypothetical protein
MGGAAAGRTRAGSGAGQDEADGAVPARITLAVSDIAGMASPPDEAAWPAVRSLLVSLSDSVGALKTEVAAYKRRSAADGNSGGGGSSSFSVGRGRNVAMRRQFSPLISGSTARAEAGEEAAGSGHGEPGSPVLAPGAPSPPGTGAPGLSPYRATNSALRMVRNPSARLHAATRGEAAGFSAGPARDAESRPGSPLTPPPPHDAE